MKTSQYYRLQGLLWFVASLLVDVDADAPLWVRVSQLAISAVMLVISLAYETRSRRAKNQGD